MKQTQRHDAIVELVKKQGYVSTEELVEQFAVSPQTIRRDLNDLAEQNLIMRHHGGAALPSSSVNTPWHDRKATQTAEKERIAQKVASQIPNGATLFIDIGTTPEAVAHALLNHSNLRIVTNNLNVANTLKVKEDFRIILAGGELRSRDGGIIGEATLDFISQFRLDFGILGISGIDGDGSLLEFDYHDTPEEARDILIKSAREKIDSYAKEIEALSAREMKKSAVEQHKHHPAQTMGGGPECVSAGAQRGEGKAKGKGPAGLYQSEGKLSKEVLCKKCGKSHELDKCGEMEKALGPFGGFSPTLDQAAKDNQKQALKGKNKDSRGYYKNPDAWKKPKEEVESKPEDPAKKSELVDAKGKKSDNHTVAGSKDSEGKSAHVNKPGKSSKTAGSGGVILPGANLKKSANPPMAKPPSGVNMGTGVPTSAPKAPKAPTAAPMAKGVLTDAARQADPISAAHAAHTAPKAAPPKSPTPEQHAQRAAGFQAAAGGAFQPPAPAPKPAATKPAIPGLASPKAAGVTRSAGPVLNAARPAPAAAKPGIFGKLFGKKP